MNTAKKHSKSAKLLLFFVLICTTVIVLCAAFANRVMPVVSGETNYNENSWALILVNDKHQIPENYDEGLTLTELSNGQKVDSRIYPYLQDMFDAMRADGFEPEVVSGYRTTEKQQSLLDEKIEAYQNEGIPRLIAESRARKWVAEPGTSEHQLGLAVDINEKNTVQSSTEFFDWLSENSAEYGFIQRYPDDKKDITGIDNEPWHYRFVGVEAAKEITSREICLEEY